MELMVVNPRKRTRAKRKANPARRKHHHHAHARNPIRRRAKSKLHRIRRRRNPASRGGERAEITQSIKDALLGGAGSVGVDALMGQIRANLPASVQSGYEYSAVKAAITIALGILAKKFMGPRALKLAEGALTVQAAMLITSFVPSTMTMGGRSRILGPAGGMRGMVTGGSMTGPQSFLPGKGLGFFDRSSRGKVISRSPNMQVTASPGATPRAGMSFFNPTSDKLRAREGVQYK